MAKLYIIATPIGNLEDITLRALRILKEVEIVLCEDTRVTKKLLDHYNITTSTLSYHAQSGIAKVEKIFELLKSGKDIALVSDAGTPTISDPGVLLVQQIRNEFKEDVNIIPIPGPSAFTAALSAGGISSAQFTFYGFLPHKKGRETIFKEIADSKISSVLKPQYVRIMKTLDSLKEHLKEDRKVVIARELTKIYEEIVHDSINEVHTYFTDNPDKVRGEFVVIIEGKH
ncbi:MAG: 16S rRNA (cytidine(1402)-2'-O)-methyltransferase [Candidatus Pacebacteria bacterium]|nr:16S rRNA (cytidine(1402)-2'-O)-methyltransferase [Candidatus Paceibacterota bacterium]